MIIQKIHCIFLYMWVFFALCSPVFAHSKNIPSYSHNAPRTSSEQKNIISMGVGHDSNADNVLDDLRERFQLTQDERNTRVQKKMRWYFQHPGYLVRTLKRASPWLYFISEQTKKRQLPAELVLLPVVESAYNPFAQNPTSGAAGIWQMMAETATGYGVRQNWWYDGRFDIVTSTKAALDHLTHLHRLFAGDWLLAMAAYDAGEGTVKAAIRNNMEKGKPTDYWSLSLPQETQDYVPRILALASIIRHPEFYSSHFPIIPNTPYLAEVKIGSQLDLRLAASLAHLSLSTLRTLNPAYNRPASEPNGPFHLVLPIENVAYFIDNLSRIDHYPRLQWVRYKVKSGETIAELAKRFHTTPENLRRKNPSLATGSLSGKHILVATTTASPKNRKKNRECFSDLYSQTSRPVSPGDTIYMVRKGDSREKIANHFNILKKNILTMRGETVGPLNVGEKVIIPMHPKEPKHIHSHKDIFYTVTNNETLDDIAHKFHITPAAIRLVNLMTDHHIHSGDQLIIPAFG